MRKSRLDNSMINSFIGVGTQILNMLLGFVLQAVFIRTLGATYLGLRGLYSNILQVLSFTELGIGTAVTFSLYKPLSSGNEQKIIQIMNFFRSAYTTIGIIIGVIGSLFIPLIPLLTHSNIKGVYLYYILFLANTVVSYFLTYKRTILNADQLNYINLNNELLFKILQTVIQIIILVVFKSFFGFCVIQIVCTVVSNIVISNKVNKLYPYLKGKNLFKHKLPSNDLKEILHNTLGTVGSKLGDIAVNGTNSVLITYFCSLYLSGVFSNYNVIINSLVIVIGQAFYSITSSVGNLIVEIEDKKYQYDIFEKIFFISFLCTFICSVSYISVINPFISLWVGSKYQLSFIIAFMMGINLILNSFRKAFSTFISAYGLYVKDGKRAIIEAIVNIVSSLIYLIVFNMGIAGVVLGNITSNILVNWYEPYIIFKYGMHQNEKLLTVFKNFVIYMITCITFMFAIYKIVSIFNINILLVNILVKGLIAVTLSLIGFYLLFKNNECFKYTLVILKKYLTK